LRNVYLEDIIEIDFREEDCNNGSWIELAKDRVQCHAMAVESSGSGTTVASIILHYVPNYLISQLLSTDGFLFPHF
jgi:hypothetical protein